MKEKHLLTYKRKHDGKIFTKCFTSKEDMKDFIRVCINAKRHWKIISKEEIKE